MSCSRAHAGARALVLASFALSALASQASAGISATPVIINAEVKQDGQALAPIKVKNTGKDTIVVRMSFSPLGHDEFGGPTVATGSAYGADKMVSVSPNNFDLAPGATKEVRVKVKKPAGRTGGAYSMMYVMADPKKVAKNATIVARTQVGVLLMLDLGGATRQVDAAGVFANQERAGGDVEVYARVTNKGKIHDRVSGLISIEGPKGQVASVRLQPGSVLPTYSRYLKGNWKLPKSVAPGTYTLRATITLGDKTTKISTGKLKVVKAGEIERSQASITKFVTPPVVQKKPLAVEAKVMNRGNIAFAPGGVLTFTDRTRKVVGTMTLKAASPIAAGKTGVITGSLPAGLPVGSYSAALEVKNADGFTVGRFGTTQQVIEKEIVLAANVDRFTAPNDKEPFFTVDLTNTGNVDVDFEGVLMVADSSGNVVGQIPLEKKRVGQKKAGSYKRALDIELEPGLYQLRLMVNFGGQKPLTKNVDYYKQ